MKSRFLPLFLLAAALAIGYAVYIRLRANGPSDLPSPSAKPQATLNITSLQDKAEKGDAASQESLGRAFVTGNGVKTDYKQAAKWFALAVTNGNVDAAAELGELNQAGQGIPRNLTNAVQLFSRAAEAGNVTGQYDLAYLYEQGQGVAKNERLAAKWYRLAAEAGDATAAYDYGQRCFLGVGVNEDAVEGLKWLLLSQSWGRTGASGKIDSFKSKMNRDQIKEAQLRASAFVARAPAGPTSR